MLPSNQPERISDVITVVLPSKCLGDVYRHFRAVGAQGLEGVALWAGKQNGHEFRVTEAIIPRQRGIRSPQGLAYVVDNDELHRINVALYHAKIRLIAQIHSHPTEAYHSDTDDAYPIMSTVGGFSIVVPDFGNGPMQLSRCAIYRLSPTNRWAELSPTSVATMFRVE